MKKDKIRQIGVILATLVILITNVISEVIPIKGVMTGSITAKINIYFMPANYAFSVWSLIYLGLILYTIYQALPAQRSNPKLRSIGWFYIGSCFMISAWMISFIRENYLLTMLTMIALLVLLIVVYEKLDVGREVVSRGMRFFVHIPFSLYLGWITMATIANISNYLQVQGWSGLGVSPKIWAVVLMVVTIVIAELTAFNRQDLAYLAVFVWAFIGIAVNHKGVSPVFEAACVSAAIVIIITIVTLIVRPRLRN